VIRAIGAGLRSLRARSSLRDIAILAGGASFGQAIVLLAYPVLTRQYEPEHFGILAVFVAILSTALPVASLRYEFAVPLPRSDGDGRTVLGVALAFAAATSLVAAFTILLTGDWLVAVLRIESVRPYLWIVPPALWAAGTYQALTYWSIRTKSFHLLARSKVTQAITTIVLQLGAGILHASPLGLIAGNGLGHAAGAANLMVATRRGHRGPPPRRYLVRMRWAARRYRRFATLSAPASLLNILAFSAPPIALTMLYGPTVAGLYALTDRAIAVPLGIVTTSIGQVYVASAARRAASDPAGLRRQYLSLSLGVLALAAIPTLAVILFAPRLFAFAFGTAWTEAGVFAGILAVAYLARAVVNPLSQTLNLLEHQGRMLALDTTRALLVAVVFVAVGIADLGPLSALAWYSLAMTVSYGAYWFAGLHAILQRLPATRP